MVTLTDRPVAGGWLDCGRAKLQFQRWNFQLSTFVWRGAPSITGRDHMVPQRLEASWLEIYRLTQVGEHQKLIWVEAKRSWWVFVFFLASEKKHLLRLWQFFWDLPNEWRAMVSQNMWSEDGVKWRSVCRVFLCNFRKRVDAPNITWIAANQKDFRQFLSNVSCLRQ